MKQYVDLITTILREGRVKTDRTGTGTISIFGHQETFYMKDGFPLLTMKKTYPRGVFEELFWFLKGDANIKYLNERNVHIWDEWADENGDLGPVYGKQWVDWGKFIKKQHNSIRVPDKNGQRQETLYSVKEENINQIQNIVDRLKTNPDCRRLIVSAWNVGELANMALTPCHAMFQFITEPLTLRERKELLAQKRFDKDNTFTSPTGFELMKEKEIDDADTPKFRLSLQLYQRSQDQFLGAPFNIASYALLLHMMAQVSNMVPYKFVHTTGDAHLYLNHKDQVNEFLGRTIHDEMKKTRSLDFWSHLQNNTEPHELLLGTGGYGPKLPEIRLNSEIKNIFDFTIDDIELVGYNPLPTIKASVAV